MQYDQQHRAQAVEQFSATLIGGGAATVTWSVSGGDAIAGPGTISRNGQYTPPPYLTANSVQVTVTATLTGDGQQHNSSATVTVTPGFLEPLSPENAALGANGTVTVSGYIAEAGGTTGINFAVSNTATGSSGGEGHAGHNDLHAQLDRVYALLGHVHGAGNDFGQRACTLWSGLSALRLQRPRRKFC